MRPRALRHGTCQADKINTQGKIVAKKKFVIITEGGSPAWLCTFNDMMTLLLTFFVLLLSMSSLDASSVKDVQEAMIDALGVMGGGATEEQTIVDKIYKLEEIGRKVKIFKNLLPPVDDTEEAVETDLEIKLPKDMFEDFKVLREEGRKERFESEEAYVFNQFKEIIHEDYYEPGVSIIRKNRGIVLRLSDNILFSPGQVKLSKSVYPVLGKIASILKSTKLNIYVEGHADSEPVQDTGYSSSTALSLARAVSVAEFLVKEQSVSPEKVGVAGYGDTRPLAEGKADQNRRIEVVLSSY